jgi:signal transduction histidine kinase
MMDDLARKLELIARSQDWQSLIQVSQALALRNAELERQLNETNERLEAERLERDRSEQMLRLIVEGTASTMGADFFQSLVRSLAQVLGVNYAFISECLEDQPTRVHSFAFWQGDRFGDEFEFDVRGTPCERVLNRQSYQFFPDQVQALFPEDADLREMQIRSYAGIALRDSAGKLLGHLAVYDHQSMADQTRTQAILEIFAARASAEMERKQTEEALARLAEIGELAAMIVHEVRNPLTTIAMGLNAFKRLQLTEQFQEYLLLSLAEAERLQRLLNQILLYSKQPVLERSHLELNSFIDDVLTGLQKIPAALEKFLKFTPASNPVFVLADPDKLKQIVINLVTNAYEAVEAESMITVRLEQQDHHSVWLQIHNPGDPIPADILPNLMKPFYTTKANGTGLGLAIVKRIVAAHDGKITIESSLATGTIVSVQLPLAALSKF